MIDDEDRDEVEEFDDEASWRDSSVDLGREIEERYIGDDRFAKVLLDEAGEEGEDFRLRLEVDDSSHFFVAGLSEEGFIRIGLAGDDAAALKAIREAIEESGLTPTEFVAEAMGGEELDFEVVALEEEATAYYTDFPFDSAEDLAASTTVDIIVSHLEGYIESMIEHLGG